MKILLYLSLIFSVQIIGAQSFVPEVRKLSVPIYEHPVKPYTGEPHILEPAIRTDRSRSGAGEIFGTYIGFDDDEQRNAFQHAISIWNSWLDLDVDIEVEVRMDDLGSGTLGRAGAAYVVTVPTNIGPVWASGAFANQFYGSDQDRSDPEIVVTMSTRPNWFYGIDGDPGSGQVDFISVAMHEICHGLGFSGSARVGSGSSNCGNSDHGCYGIETNSGNDTFPHIFDAFVRDGGDNYLLDLPNYSDSVKRYLQGQAFPVPARALAGQLIFDGSNTGTASLYTPSTWNGGSSYSHFGTSGELMYYAFMTGQKRRNPGRALDLLVDLGFERGSGILPVTLTEFVVRHDADLQGVAVSWQTNTELSSSHFAIERSSDGQSWTTLTEIEAQGYRMRPMNYRWVDRLPALGENFYRLRMFDLDGSEDLSEVQAVDIYQNHTFRVYPTMAQDQITVLTQGEATEFSILDHAGRVVLSGTLDNRKTTLQLQRLAEGSYVIRLRQDEMAEAFRFIRKL